MNVFIAVKRRSSEIQTSHMMTLALRVKVSCITAIAQHAALRSNTTLR